jgi:hypothetical protein
MHPPDAYKMLIQIAGQSPFTRPSELNVPITILPRPDFENCFENTFSAVEIHPGDIIVADIDGVVCVPPELLVRVLDNCRYSRHVDEKCMMDIQQGRSVQEVRNWCSSKSDPDLKCLFRLSNTGGKQRTRSEE